MDTSPFKGTGGIRRLLNATGYSIAGLKAAFKGEAAFRQLVYLSLILVPISFLLPVSAAEQALLVAVCLLSLVIELLNSAIEATVDRISLERHPLAKNAKDMGSAAQMIGLLIILSTWSIILLPVLTS